MSVARPSSLDFIVGVSTKIPCCLINGNTVSLGNPQPGETGVRLGVGDGSAVVSLAERVGTGGFVYGVEMSKDVLSKARRRIDKAGYENVDFIHSIFEEVELEDGVADLVVSDCSIALSQEKASVWEEIQRLLKPEGRFVISDIFSDDSLSRLNAFKRRDVACLADLMTKEAYLDMLDRSGFEKLTIVEESVPYSAQYLDNAVTLTSFVVSGQLFTC